jgi:uncharacterized protein YheU (UPF0270 family)
MGSTVVVPYRELASEVLKAVVEDFVTREGTDYGLHEHSLEQKCAAVLKQLERGDVLIIFEPETEYVTLVRREELAREGAMR